ncbi:MAG: hypothetical protein D6679_00610 [Candidatus Hydrogenedentota bacterium]|nr:MAG: hypothetical protein D6679_00610 [Candidatus Hydrogenedentota bacterium]
MTSLTYRKSARLQLDMETGRLIEAQTSCLQKESASATPHPTPPPGGAKGKRNETQVLQPAGASAGEDARPSIAPVSFRKSPQGD